MCNVTFKRLCNSKERFCSHGAMPTKLLVASQVGGVVYIGGGNGVWVCVGNVGCGRGVGGYGACMRNHMIVYPRCVVERECCMYWRWLRMSTERFLCLRPSLMIRENPPARLSGYCICVMRRCKTNAVVYCVSSSQYDWMMSMRFFARHFSP